MAVVNFIASLEMSRFGPLYSFDFQTNRMKVEIESQLLVFNFLML